jgi:hypothetical protein
MSDAKAKRESRDRWIRELARRGELVATITKAMRCSQMTVRRALGRVRSPG